MRYYLRSMFARRFEVLFATANFQCHFHTLDTMNISVFCLPPAAILGSSYLSRGVEIWIKRLQVYCTCRHNFMVRIFDVFYVSIIMYNRHPDIWWAHLCHPHFVPSSSWWWISWPPCKEVTCFSPRIVSTRFEAKPQLWANKTICWEANRAYKDKLMSCERTNWQLTWKSTCFKKVMECKNTKNTKAHTEIM